MSGQPGSRAEGRIEVTGGFVWYRIAGNGEGTPLIVLHGGPGGNSRYLYALDALAEDRPVVYYDQLGGGLSDHPDDCSLWTIARSVDELRRVREALGLTRTHILGHSYGGLVGLEYAIEGATGITSLVLSNTAVSVPRYVITVAEFCDRLPRDHKQTIAAALAGQLTASERLQHAVLAFQQRYLCRATPWPPVVVDGLSSINARVFMTQWGATPFAATGPLATYDRCADLSGLSCPVLFTTGHHDPVTPAHINADAAKVPTGQTMVFDGAHVPTIEAPAQYIQTVRRFLKRAEAIAPRRASAVVGP